MMYSILLALIFSLLQKINDLLLNVIANAKFMLDEEKHFQEQMQE